MNKRPWTQGELAVLADLWPTHTSWQIAKRMGRSKSAIEQKIGAMRKSGKLNRKMRRTKYDARFRAFVREKHAQGWSDAEIGDAWDCDRHAVGKARRKMNLPSNRMHARQRQRVARVTRLQCQLNSVGSLAELQQLRRRRDAAVAGWPPDCTPIMVGILNLLESEPRTRRGLCASLGRRYHRCKALQTSNGRSALQALIDMGVVRRSDRRVPFAAGKGNTAWMYDLTDEARAMRAAWRRRTGRAA